jgi:steroid 5-alpha reductase family enzyme
MLPSLLFRVAGAAGGWVALDFVIQLAGFAISYPLRTEKLYDMFGTGTYALVAVGSFVRSSLGAQPGAGAAPLALKGGLTLLGRQAAATAMVGLWAARLGSFLVYRVHKTGADSRFDAVKHDPARFFVSWALQGVWVAVVVAPVLLLNCAAPAAGASAAAAAAAAASLRWTDVAGPLLWLAGWATEAVADQQKLAFKLDPANKGRFVDTGLWSLARHPNYGAEIATWSGLALFCAGSGALSGPGAMLACAASPAFVAAILLGLSGVNVQRKQAEARWGGQAEYKAYKARTNLLFPLPFALPAWAGGPEESGGGGGGGPGSTRRRR